MAVFILASVLGLLLVGLCEARKLLPDAPKTACTSSVCGVISGARKWLGAHQVIFYGGAVALCLPFLAFRRYYSAGKCLIVTVLLAWLILSPIGYLVGQGVCDISSIGDAIKGI